VAGPIATRKRTGVALFQTGDRWATERVGLVLPTSMCSAQIRAAAGLMNANELGADRDRPFFIALTTTEGMRFGGETNVL